MSPAIMAPVCGICRRPSDLLCPNCVNFELLPVKLQYIESLSVVEISKTEINQILRNVNDNDFIKRFLNDELDLKDEVQMSVVLGSRLLTIDLLLLSSKLSRMRRSVEHVRNQVSVKRNVFDGLKHKIEEKRENIRARREMLSMKRAQTINELQLDNSRLINQINISKSLLFQELINLSILKKKKTSNNSNTYMLSFSPILSVFNILEFDKDAIDSSLQKSIKFVNSVSKILLLILPYDITVNYSYLSTQIFELRAEEAKEFTLLLAKLIHNTLYLLENLELIDITRVSLNQLFGIDELIYKLSYNDHKLSEESTDKPVKPLTLYQLNERILKYITSKARSQRSEWHMVEYK